MKHLLLSPHKVHPSANAGWHFITAGIEYLLGRADENATFETLDAFSLSAETMPKADYFSQFDRVVLCGNPRWGFGENGVRYTAYAQHVSERGVVDTLKQVLAAL